MVHCFARCHWCKKLVAIREDEDGALVLTERECANCGADLTEQHIRDSLFENLFHTWAVTSANKFISFDLAIIPFMGVSILITFMEFPLWIRILNLLIYHMPIILCLQWFYKYWYYVRFTDEEYSDAVGRMRRLLVLWTGANLVNWIFILAQTFHF